MKNNKGFVLVETLVVTVFVVTVFTMIFVQYTPALSEFERREYSDDIDSKYDIYWVKMMVQSEDYISNAKWTTIKNRLYSSSGNTPYVELTHDYFTDYPDCTVGTAQCIIDKVKYVLSSLLSIVPEPASDVAKLGSINLLNCAINLNSA